MRAKLSFVESNILDVDVACITRNELLQQVGEWVRQSRKKTILYTNAHCMNVARQDIKYRAVLNLADLVYADGIGVVWSSRLLYGRRRIEKITGADWIEDYCSLAQSREWRTFILAGKPGIVQLAAKNLLDRFPRLQIVGGCDGFSNGGDMDDATLITKINQSRPHVVFVGMGVPRQEKWLATQRNRIDAPVCWAVGALFDYVAGLEPRVPRWLDSIGLEWLWRLLIDPKGKWRRYIIGNPAFIYRILHQKMTGK